MADGEVRRRLYRPDILVLDILPPLVLVAGLTQLRQRGEALTFWGDVSITET